MGAKAKPIQGIWLTNIEWHLPGVWITTRGRLGFLPSDISTCTQSQPWVKTDTRRLQQQRLSFSSFFCPFSEMQNHVCDLSGLLPYKAILCTWTTRMLLIPNISVHLRILLCIWWDCWRRKRKAGQSVGVLLEWSNPLKLEVILLGLMRPWLWEPWCSIHFR